MNILKSEEKVNTNNLILTDHLLKHIKTINKKVMLIVGGFPILAEVIGKYYDNVMYKGVGSGLFSDTGDVVEVGIVSVISIAVAGYISKILHEKNEQKYCLISEHNEVLRIKRDVDRILNHELKGTLAGVVSLPDLLLSGPENENLTEEQKDIVRIIKKCGSLMSANIDEGNIFFQIEEESYQVNKTDFNLTRMLNDIISFLTLQGERIKIVDKNNEDMKKKEIVINGDEKLLLHLFANIIKNAMESNDFKVSNVKIIYDETETEYHIMVENNKEIPDQVKDRFFEKLATFGKINGTGFGTYLSKKIVDLHNGKITFTTRNNFTQLHIVLPKQGI